MLVEPDTSQQTNSAASLHSVQRLGMVQTGVLISWCALLQTTDVRPAPSAMRTWIWKLSHYGRKNVHSYFWSVCSNKINKLSARLLSLSRGVILRHLCMRSHRAQKRCRKSEPSGANSLCCAAGPFILPARLKTSHLSCSKAKWLHNKHIQWWLFWKSLSHIAEVMRNVILTLAISPVSYHLCLWTRRRLQLLQPVRVHDTRSTCQSHR